MYICFNFITTSGCLARKREWVHFGPNPWDWDGNEICGQIFSGSRTGHTCSVRLVDFEGEGLGEKISGELFKRTVRDVGVFGAGLWRTVDVGR